MSKQKCETVLGAVDAPQPKLPPASPTRQEHSRVEERRRAVVALLNQQLAIAEIALRTGYSTRWVREIAQRYRDLGATALVDQRVSCGAAPLLSEATQRALQIALQSPPPGGGRWTGPKVARWIEAETGRRVHRQRGWEYLRRLEPGLTE